MAPPSDDEVRLSPPLRRFHQLCLSVCCRSCGARDSRFGMTPEEMVARLLYRDGLMLVIDKPAGCAVHRGPKGGDSLEDYFDALRFGLPRAPALAHRLDRDTSGCLVLGRHRKALESSANCSSKATSARPIGRWWRGAPRKTKAASICRSAKRDDDARLVDEGRSRTVMPSVTHLEGHGPGRRRHLACARAIHRAHASIARSLRRDGMAGFR